MRSVKDDYKYLLTTKIFHYHKLSYLLIKILVNKQIRHPITNCEFLEKKSTIILRI